MEAPFHWCVVLEWIQGNTREQVEFCCNMGLETSSNELLQSNKQKADR